MLRERNVVKDILDCEVSQTIPLNHLHEIIQIILSTRKPKRRRNCFRCDKYSLFIYYLQCAIFFWPKSLFTASKETSEVVAVSALGRLFLSV